MLMSCAPTRTTITLFFLVTAKNMNGQRNCNEMLFVYMCMCLKWGPGGGMCVCVWGGEGGRIA